MNDESRFENPDLFSPRGKGAWFPEARHPSLETTLDRVNNQLIPGMRKHDLGEELEVDIEDEDNKLIQSHRMISSAVIQYVFQVRERYRLHKAEDTNNPDHKGIKGMRLLTGAILHAGLNPLWHMTRTAEGQFPIKDRLDGWENRDIITSIKYRQRSIHLGEVFEDKHPDPYWIGYLNGFDKMRLSEIYLAFNWKKGSVVNLCMVWGAANSQFLIPWSRVKEAREAVMAFVAYYNT